MFRLVTCLLILGSLTAQAEDKLECTAEELSSKSCHLAVGSSTLELRPENILVFSGAQAKLFPTPFQSSLSNWESVELRKVKAQVFLDFVSWDMPGNAGQNLMQSIQRININVLEPISTRAIQSKKWTLKDPKGEYTHREQAKISVDSSGKIEVKY